MEKPGPANTIFVLPAMTAGGAERVLITLMNGLDHEKFNPALVSFSDKGPLVSLVDVNIPYHCLFSSVPRGLPHLYRKLKTLQPDIVVSTMAHTNFAVLLLKPFFPRTRFVVREAITPSFILRRHAGKGLLIRAAYKILYPLADLVISPANAIIDEFAAMGVKTDNHRLLPNPVDTRRIRGIGNMPERAHQGTTEFLCAGRLHHQKGYDRLLDILQGVTLPNWHLTILGDGEERRKLEIQITVLGLGEKVTLAGHEEVPWPYMAAADCLLLPSRYEGLPNVVLESLAAGTRVIATIDSGGVREIAEKAPKDAVIVATDMQEFLAAMNHVPPKPVKDYRPSLLPASFEKNAVIGKFSELLGGLKAKSAGS